MKKVNLAIALFAMVFAIACHKNETTTDKYQLNSETSVVKWKGFLRTGYFNEGTIRVESSNIEIADSQVKKGSFKMPLISLLNENLPPEQKPLLIHHLQSADFFNMALHPDISFTFEKSERYKGQDENAVAGANFSVTGLLSILGKPLPVTFPAKITVSENQLVIEAKLKVDRTKWGITYNSDPSLPDKDYILPEMEISLNLQGEKN